MSETYKEMVAREAIHDKHKEDAKMDSFPPMPKISDTYKEFNKDEFISMLNKLEAGK